MIIDRDKHNKYVVGWKPNYTVPTNQGSSSGTNVTIVYGGGGSGSSTPVSSEAFSYYKVSDGENAITQEAKVQKDVANLSIIGDEGIKVELITDPTIFEASFTSTGTNTGVYKISYGKVTTVVEKPETQAEEPTEPEVVITFPMTITYVSGEKIKAEQFDTLRLLNDTEEVATYPSSGLAIEGDADGILSISLEVYKEVQSVDEEGKPVQDGEGNPVMEKQGLYFNRILLTTQLEDQPSTQAEGDSTEEEPQQPTYESLLSFDVVVNIDTVIKLSSDSGAGLWKLDDNGNIYTEYNAYSLKELSAYGPGKGEAGEGAGFLHELGDVSIPDPNAIPDNAILQYNIETGKWEAVELELPEDSATREWVEQKFKDLINGAPADLDTLGEIAIAIQELQQLLDWFSFVDGRIRANYNFWGVGEISAYGPASGSDPGTGGGAGYLHELGDVTINNDTLTDGQIIVWDEDSQMWVNADFPGLDEDALALYLTQNKYATQGWVNNQLDPINNKLEEFQTTIDMINDMFEWDNGKIKAKATLYSVGEISAYGAGEGSSGTDGYLHELDDVLLTSLQDDQLLMYDATIEKWVNVDKNSVGLNETELEQYLITHNYVTSDQVVSPTRRIIAGVGLTGGGALSSDVTLSLAASGVTSGVYTKVTVDQYGRVTAGAFLVEDDIPNIAWSKIHSTPTTLAGYGITDAYTMQQSDERYVNVTGDTMTGNLILPTLQANTSIILGSVKLEYDSANKALKISHIDGSTAMNVYATGEVSAYGAGIGSAGGGKEYLQDLLDVLVTELTDNQLLMYDAEQQKWINIDKDQVGLNESELQNYLTTNQYTTQSWVDQQLEAYVTINQFTSELNDKVDKEDGKGLSSNDFTDELLAKLNGITAGAQGTFTKVTTNGYGQVISGTTLSAADIPGLDWSKIISGKPTTLAGYGITDGVNAVSVTGTGNAVTTASISGHTLTLTKALSFALITGTNATGTWPISITGNAATANKWTTARTITLAGSVIGSTSIDGSGNVTITTTYTTDNISALDGRYVNVTGDTMTGNLILPTLQANTSIILGSVKLEYDSASNALKISNVNTRQVINLYATGEISAYGYNDGSADEGVSILDDLDDVTLSNLQNGQALVYNSSTRQWVNTTIQAGGIDETALAEYLTSHLYVTQSWVNSQNYATEADLDARIDALVNGAPAAFDTLKEIADVLQGNVDSIGDILTALGNKADKTITITAGTGLTGGGNLSANRTISLATVGTAGTYTKVTVDAYGRVTGHASLAATDIPNLPWSKITSGKPTTLAGYGITDAYTKTEADGRYVNVSGDTMTGNLTLKPLGGPWLNGKTQAPIMTNGASSTTGSTYHPIIWGKTDAGDVWNLAHGALDQVGFFGFYSERTANGTDWSTYIKVSTGVFYQSKAMNVAGLITATAGLTTPQYIQIGSGRIKWDSSNNALYVEKSDGTAIGFYSKGFISAKGANDDAGGSVSGVTALSQLSDVTLGTLANGQALVWNGSKWANKTIESGLDETALAQYLTNNGYATQGWATSHFAYKTGTNASGTWPISVTGHAGRLSSTYTGNGGAQPPSYFNGMGLKVNMMNIPVSYSDVIVVNGYGGTGADVPYINAIAFQKTANAHGEVYHARAGYGASSWGTWYKFLDEYNYTSILDSRYLRTVSLATISDLHSSWDAVLKAQKPAWLTTVSLATISDLHASWDALLKAAPTAYVTRWPTAAEVGALTQTSADARYLLKSAYTAADVLAKIKTVDGSGSGLDADTLDGYHLSNIETGGWTSFTPYVYDATDGTRYYCYRIGNLNVDGDVILRIRVVTDINYPSYSEWTLRMAYNSNYAPVVSLIPNTPCRNTFTVYVDTSRYLWIKCNAVWSSYMQYKIEHNTGNILITSNPLRVETSPSNVSYTFSNFGSTRNGVADSASYTHYASTYNATTSVKIGNGTITWDSANNCFHFSHGLYSDSFVSAKGANSGSGGTVSGVTKLSELSDVQLGTLATNQVLSWNGSKWVNKTLDMGLDETALAQYLTNNQYLTMPTGDGRYVTLSTAQTINGKKTFTALPMAVGTNWGKRMTNDTSNYEDVVAWYNTSLTKIAGIGYHNTMHNIVINPMGSSEVWNDAVGKYSLFVGNNKLTYNTYPILTSNNYTSYIGNSFVKKTGDTMTGALTVPSLAVSGSTATVSGNKVWHAGNDGSGSGLDADLLDGLHYSSFESYRVVQINASSLNQNTWYPVTMAIGNSQQTRIRIEGNTSANASWNPRADKYMALILDYTVNGSSWGWTNVQRVIYQYMEGAGTSSCLRGLGQLTNTSTEYVFVRGGAVYNFYVSRFITPVLRTSTYTVGEQSVSPTTTAPAVISRTNALITDNVYSATQLQTARTINGTAFNGTSNIVTSYWGTARTLSLTGNATGSVSMNGSANVSMSVNVNYATSAGNADTLDGLHSTSLMRYSYNLAGEVTSGITIADLMKTYDGYARLMSVNGWNWASSKTIVLNSSYSIDIQRYSLLDFRHGYLNTSWQQKAVLCLPTYLDSKMIYIAQMNTGETAGSVSTNVLRYADYDTILASNVYSASKLQTARSIWGQSFNGTANVSGNMTGVGSITASGYITITNNSYFVTQSGWFQNSKSGCGLYNSAQDARWYATNNVWNSDKGIYASGDVTAPSFYASNWFRSTGATGWYSETYGGGIYMTDSTYVRVYNGKRFYAAGGQSSPYSAGSWISMATRTNCIQGDQNNSTSSAHALYRVKAYNGNALCFGGLGNNLGFYAFTAANISSSTNVVWKNTYWDMTNWTLHHGGVLHCTGGIYSDSYVSAKGNNSSSDIRLKNILCPIHPSLEAFAKAPLFRFAWKSDPGMVEIGSSAQYWKNVLPDTVKERDGWLEMGYGNIALAGVITIAREVETLEQRVDRLEKENYKLKKKVKELERRAA